MKHARKAQAKRARGGRAVLSVEDQCKLVAALRDDAIQCADTLPLAREFVLQDQRGALRDVDAGERGTPNQAIADLEHAWRLVVSNVDLPPLLMDRTRAFDAQIADSPILALASYIGYGYYPPPELLLAFHHVLETYLEAKGRLTLEECFFGKPKPRAGNYAARRASAVTESMWAFEVMASATGGSGDLATAEEIVKREGLSIDPESLLRRARKRLKRVKKTEK